MYQFNKGPAVTGERQTYSDIENWGYNNKYMSGNLTGHITPRLGPDHSFSLMAGWNIEDKTYDAIKTYRQGILYPSQPRRMLISPFALRLVPLNLSPPAL